MECELRRIENPRPRPSLREQQRSDIDKQLVTLDIAAISAPAFHINLKKKSNEFFTTSLYEIDRLITEKREERLDAERVELAGVGEVEETEEEMLYRTVPSE